MLKVTIFVIVLVGSVLAVKQEDVKFLVYNATINVTVDVPMGEFVDVVFNKTKEVKILCHGWLDNGNIAWVNNTVYALVSQGLTNVISVDWSKHAVNPSYHWVVLNIKAVAKMVANLIQDMAAALSIQLDKIHLIGHSLGAHIFGFAAKILFAATGQKIGRITGLDPAGPSYNFVPDSQRLSKNDARFVDVIHTWTLLYGYKFSLAHVDFWPNGGTSQPGCMETNLCSHYRSTEYYIESISSNSFAAWKCTNAIEFYAGHYINNTRIVMGEHVDQLAHGDYYLQTNAQPPFARN